jgi:predicted metal-binding integral membrane protein DUF2182
MTSMARTEPWNRRTRCFFFPVIAGSPGPTEGRPKDRLDPAMTGGGGEGSRTVRVVGANRSLEIPRRKASEGTFLGVAALLFAAGALGTILWGAAMSAMGGMPMPGGWWMSMTWMRMPGQSWPGVAVSFLGMWVAMMVAMMLPSLVPMLRRYRQAVGGVGETRLGRLTLLVGLGYFFVWTLVGMAIYPLGIALAAAAMQLPALARAVPVAAGAVVLIAGALQLTAWKLRHLAYCRQAPGGLLPGGTGARPCVAGGCRHGLAPRSAPRPPLQQLLCGPDGDPPGHRGHGSARDGCRDGRHHPRASRTGRRARRPGHRGRRRRSRVAPDRAGSRARMTHRHPAARRSRVMTPRRETKGVLPEHGFQPQWRSRRRSDPPPRRR